LKLHAAFIATILCLTSAPAFGDSNTPEWTWRFPVGQKVDSWRAGFAERFSKCVSITTNDRLQIKVVYEWPKSVRKSLSTLTAETDIVAILGTPSRYFHARPIFEVSTLGMLANNRIESERLWRVAKPTILRELREENLHLLLNITGTPDLLLTKNKIDSLADLKGGRMWTYSQRYIAFAEAIGAEPYRNDGGNGARDALHTGLVKTAFLSSTWPREEYIKALPGLGITHAYNIGAWLYRSVMTINRETWLNLDQDIKSAVELCSRQSEELERVRWEKRAVDKIDWLQEAGIIVVEPSENLLRELDVAGEKIVEEWIERVGDEGQAIIDAYRKE